MEELYRSLPCGARDIRLLRISDRTSEGEGIACDLRVHDQDDTAFEFKALSYCWGEAEAFRVIKVNNVPCNIRCNLHDVLLQLIEDEDPSWIFIDAVCIKQSDTAEKSQQVPLMGDIYRDATEVLAWLRVHEDDDDDDLLLWTDLCNFGNRIVESAEADMLQSRMMYLMRYAQGLKHTPSTDSEYQKLIYRWSEEFAASMGGNQQFFFRENEFLDPREYSFILFWMIQDRGTPLVSLLMTFSRDKYWTRLWVVPEMVLARNFVFRVGSLRMDWRALLLFLRFYGFDLVGVEVYPLEDRRAWDDHDSDEDENIGASETEQLTVRKSSSALTDYLAHMIVQEKRSKKDNAYQSLPSFTTRAHELLGWKRRMQHKACRRRVLLYEALLCFGQQQFSVPHDASYGLVGLSPSRLLVDYKMPILELRIRTLIDVAVSIFRNCHPDHIDDVLYQV